MFKEPNMNQLLERYKRDLRLRGFSEPTYKTYLLCIKQFLLYCDQPIENLDCERIKDYQFHLLTEKKASDSKVRQVYSALKYFYIQTLGRSWEEMKIPQLRKKKKLPSCFTFNEVISIIEHSANIKHRTLLTLIYSSGLRVSEAAKIKLTNIKREKNRLLVSLGKGGKDRYTILSDICLDQLENYWRLYKPEYWLFPGRKGNPLSARACQHAFYRAKEKAGITKEGGIHILRHSFATHFLESGGGLFQLQKFMGHKCLKTTLVYAHVQDENIVATSPLDFYGKRNDRK
jgi:integrase/recombinase XerD